MDQGETLERVNGRNDGNVQSCWQQAWPFDLPENLKFCRTIHTRGFYEGIINISHSSDVEDDWLTNRGGQQDDNDGHQSPVLVINQNISWLGDKHWALLAIMIILLTTSVGQPIILYIAAMGNIDNSLVEAARVDGATELQVFWKIKWPSLLPTTLYIAIITTINSFQVFALIQLLTSGGPNYSTSTLMYYLYEKAFQLTEYGYANTIGVFLAVMIAIVSFAQFKILGNDVEY